MPRVSPDFGETVKVGRYRIEAAYLRFVADMLRRHGGRKSMLRRLEEGVIMATPETDNTGMPRGSGISDPTPAAAARLDDDTEPTFKARVHLRMQLALIEEVFERLPADQQVIIREIYFRRDRTLTGVGRLLNYQPRQMARKRNQALAAFAVEIIGDHILLPLGE